MLELLVEGFCLLWTETSLVSMATMRGINPLKPHMMMTVSPGASTGPVVFHCSQEAELSGQPPPGPVKKTTWGYRT